MLTPALAGSVATTVWVAAPATLQRHGLVALLKEVRPDLTLLISPDPRALAAAAAAARHRDALALVVLDAALPGVVLADLIGELQRVCPTLRLLVLGGKKLPFRVVRQLVETGGGFLSAHRATAADALTVLTRLLSDCPPPRVPLVRFAKPAFTSSYATSSSGAADSPPLLSERELQVLHLLVRELDNAEIAHRLCLSVRTVESHRRMLLRKVGVRTCVGLVMVAVRYGWVKVG